MNRLVYNGVMHAWAEHGANALRSICGGVTAVKTVCTFEPAPMCRVCPSREDSEWLPIEQACKCGNRFALQRLRFEDGRLVEDESRCGKCRAVLWHSKGGKHIAPILEREQPRPAPVVELGDLGLAKPDEQLTLW